MTRTLARLLPFGLALGLALSSCRTTPDYSRSLPEGAPALIPLGPDEAVPDFRGEWEGREEILPALERSLSYLRREHSKRFYPQAGISHERALRSLERFRQILTEARGPDELQAALERDFQVYRSAGWNGKGGGVLFTAYCTPILKGSLERSPQYDEPLYGLPPDLVKGPNGEILGWETAIGRMPAYPSRGAIEAGGILADKGLELVWLRDPIDAYIAHVNGSAFIELEDGSMYRLGYAGKNGKPYTSLGRELEDEGRIPKGQASLARIRGWAAKASATEVEDFLRRNESYVFFTPIDGNPHGSLDVEVTARRSIATDKALFPRGSLVFVDAGGQAAAKPKGFRWPWQRKKVTEAPSGPRMHRLFLDQDTGGAIRTAGRADLYLGIGPEAEDEAGRFKATGQMYYLFVRD